jgi:hypothetical protein
MKIQLYWDQVPTNWRPEDYTVIEDYWDDSEEWFVALVDSEFLKQEILLRYREFIVWE